MIRKKLVTAAALTAVTALLLAGCGRTDEGAAEPDSTGLTDGPATGTVTIWAQGTEGEALQEFVKPFEEANPDVTVEVTAIPWGDALNKYQTAVAGGTTPDIGMLGSDWMANFDGALQPVPAGLDTSGIFPAALANAEIDGDLAGVPWYVDTRVIFYRTDLLEQTGIDEFPTTWDGLYDLAKAYQTDAGATWGMSILPSGFNVFLNLLPFLWSNGGELITDDNTQWTIDSPDNAEALAFINSLFQDGIADKDLQDGMSDALFVDGTTPMVIGGPWNIAVFNEAGGAGMDDKFALAPFPSGPNGESTSFIGGSNLSVFKDAKNSDAAWKLIQWLSDPETQVAWFDAVSALPSQQAAWEAPSLANDEKVSVFGAQLSSAKAAPTVSTWSQVSAAGDTAIEQMIRAGKSPEDTAKDIQSQADALGVGN